jgi:hypothetical protein
MKYLVIFLTLLIGSFMLYSLSAQTNDKTKYKDQSENDAGFDEPYHMEKYSKREFNNSGTSWQRPMTLSLDEPVYFHYQSPNTFFAEAFPVSLSNGQILMVWKGMDTLKCAHSDDGGLTWGTPVVIISGGEWPGNISGVRTTSGRVLTGWKESSGLWLSYSDDHGINWSPPVSITYDGGNISTITQTLDGKLWLFYNRWDSSTLEDIYYRTSIDDGLNWSGEQTFAATTFNETSGAVISGTGSSTLLAFYADDSNGNFDIYMVTSSDGGATWSTPSPIVNSVQDESRPRVLRQTNGDLWMIYQMFNPTPVLPDYSARDLYYIQSFDGGNTWTTPTQFTQYVGRDWRHNADLVSNQPFVSFISWRWGQWIYQQQIWYGLIGTTQDLEPPPAVFNGNATSLAPNDTIYIQAFVDDENSISDVKLSYDVNGTPFGPVQMFDDGLHNDEDPGDNIWGESIGSWQLEDFISYAFSVTDITNNTVNVESGSFDIRPTHNAGNVILNFLPNSQLADMESTSGSNAYWPKDNGDDYLFSGGLWIGWNGLGDYRVMNVHYGDKDWDRTFGSAITLEDSISNQDYSMTYDDQSAMSPLIGLQVHQESYQWSDPTRDDFIIFQYTIKNTGDNGDLSDLYTALWTDPDVGGGGEDLGGYDNSSGLIYLYDSQGIPNGYIGLKLLGEGNMPSTAVIERPLGSDDFAKYNYMTSEFPTLPTDPNDYDMLLTAQPFDLADGNTIIVAFGLVMGGSLTELQENADNMETTYNNIVGIEDFMSNVIPTKFSLAQNYPNPFNPATTISYSLPLKSQIELVIYNTLGESVMQLVNEEKEAGRYSVEFNAITLPSGIYFYRLQAGEFMETKKMVLMK